MTSVARMASMRKTEFASHQMTGFIFRGYAVVGMVLALDESIAGSGYQTPASITPSLTIWRSSSRGFQQFSLELKDYFRVFSIAPILLNA
ncbi:hypothetical protein Fmac_005159 [Flemingia macrophylla]|uniref:Uncharacterized protein n=1 Tax=Flemingia macrophylla TaxID=520843 RepID=A0ABD1N748_9FABA